MQQIPEDPESLTTGDIWVSEPVLQKPYPIAMIYYKLG